VDFSLDIDPNPNDLSLARDYYNNQTHYFSIQVLHETLSVRATSSVEVSPQYVPDIQSTPTCKQTRDYLQTLSPHTTGLVEEFKYPSPLVPMLDSAKELASDCLTDDTPVLAGATKLAHKIYSEFEFNPHATEWSTPVAEVFQSRSGVCQDFAHIMLCCLRAYELPAMYVSGYLLTHPPKGKPRLIGADASHAWVSLYVPEAGWVDIDPTNNLIVADEHITVARGRDYSDVSPLRGEIIGGGAHEIDIQVTVMPYQEWLERV